MSGFHVSLSQRNGEPEPLGVDLVKDVAPAHILIVHHGNGADRAGDFRRDLHDIDANSSIAAPGRPLEMVPHLQRDKGGDGDEAKGQGVAAQQG